MNNDVFLIRYGILMGSVGCERFVRRPIGCVNRSLNIIVGLGPFFVSEYG